MVKRTVNAGESEPNEKKEFSKPSEREHLLQVTDIFTCNDEIGQKLGLDENSVSVKLEVVGGDEAGRTMLNRLSLDENWKGFFATRMFLKAIGEQYKGDGLEIDTDRWIGRQAYAEVIHNGQYANIKEYNFEKNIEQVYAPPVSANTGATTQVSDPKDIAWEE